MPVLVLRLTALAASAISVSGYVMEVHGGRARSDARSRIGLPIQDVAKRLGEPERMTGDAARQRYVRKEYENYSHDYGYTYYEQGHGNAPNGSVLNQEAGTANQSSYYTCIHEFFADVSGRVTDTTTRDECRWFRASFTSQRAIDSASHRPVSNVTKTPESNAEALLPLAPP